MSLTFGVIIFFATFSNSKAIFQELNRNLGSDKIKKVADGVQTLPSRGANLNT